MIFRLPARNESLSYIIEVSTGILKACGIDSNELSKIILAIEEAVINSIKYAYGPEEEGDLELDFEVRKEKFSVVIKDFGKGIDPKRLKIYDVNDIDSIVSANGRGFFLMQAMMDEFMVDSIPGKGTEVHISKHLGGLECL